MSPPTGRLLREPIVDPSEPDEAMRGYPITRETSADGRWEYTLYDGGGSHPFVHALDTVGREALCIDLDALAGRPNLYDLRLGPGDGGGALVVRDDAAIVTTIDLATHRASATPPPRPAPATKRAGGPQPAGDPAAETVGAAIVAALLIAGGFALAARRRPASVPEVAPVREHHRDAGTVGGLDDLVVADRATGLDDRGDARVDRELGPV